MRKPPNQDRVRLKRQIREQQAIVMGDSPPESVTRAIATIRFLTAQLKAIK